MKCCVPSCGLTNRKHPSSVLCEHERHTFQEFPTLPWLKKAWLERVGIKECDLPQGAVVCKQHFVKDDFFEIGKHSVIMKLRKNSVPSVFKSNSTFEFCVICLDTGASKLYVLKKSHLAQAFTSMTGLQIKVVRDLIKTVPKLCTECAQRLTNCEAFKHKAMRAHDVLIQLLQRDKVITAESIKSVNRVDNLLISNMVKHTFRPDHCDLRLVHNEGGNYVQQEKPRDIISENSHENMSKSEENATDNEIDYLNDLNDIYSNQIVKRHEFDDDDDDSIADNVANNKGNSDLEVEYLDVDIERDPDDVDVDSKHDNDVDDGSKHDGVSKHDTDVDDGSKHDDDSKHDTDVDDDSKHDDNDVDDDSKQDKDTDYDILNNIDIDIGNIDKLLNKKYINKSLLDKLKATNNSKNRVSLNNVIFVKDAKPVINKDNANLNPSRDIDITVRKSVTNEHINKQRKEKKQEQNSKRNKEGKGTIKQSKLEAINNDDSGDNNEKPIITRSKSKSLSQVAKINEDVSKSIKTHDFSGMELKFLTRTKRTYEEQIADVQKRKDTERYKSSPFKCDICFKGFWQLPSYNTHMDTHTNKYGHLECAICGVHTRSFPRLRKHLSSVHSERYSCTLCVFTTSARIVALSHDQWHRGQILKCSKCDAKFRNSSSYLSHMRIKHPSHYACALCGYSFISPAGVKAHIRLKHPNDDVKKVSGPTCQECQIRFASDTAYQQHLKVSPKHAALGRPERNVARSTCVYPQPRLKTRRCVYCPLCEKAFSAPAKLREHMCLHTGARPYRCEECGKGFTQKSNHKLHMRTHADNPLRFPCGVCHKDFSSVCNRARHMQSHTGSRPAHECSVCDKTFTTAVGRDCHVAHVHHRVPRPKRLRTRSHADTQALVTRETIMTSMEQDSTTTTTASDVQFIEA